MRAVCLIGPCVVLACNQDTGTGSPEPEPIPSEVETLSAAALGLDAVSLNGRVQPHGRPTRFRFELGATTAYGRTTDGRALPAKRAAYYRESWDDGPGGWYAGLSGTRLVHEAAGGRSGGYVTYEVPGELDAAHADGIGANALLQYLFCGGYELAPSYAALGGGDPDLRGARISVDVRGRDFVPGTSEMVFWMQATPDLAASYDDATARFSNWAYTGAPLTEHLTSGAWERAEYVLSADSDRWTYAGHYVAAGRDTYIYVPLDTVLGHLNADLFHMLVLFEYGAQPSGSIDFDEIEIAYANANVLLPAHGGRLRSFPEGGSDPAALTDGWRNGEGRVWESAASPVAPLELVYELPASLHLTAVQVHQNPAWPSQEIEALASSDGESYELLARGTLPDVTPQGPSFAYVLYGADAAARAAMLSADALAWRTEPARFLKVRVLSGYQAERWGLGEVELFASDASLATDDEWVHVTADLGALEPGVTYHYRLVAESEGETVVGEDHTFTTPASGAPLVQTLAIDRIGAGTARCQGRVNPLGQATNYRFEFGTDDTYGRFTGERYAGLEITPRTVTDVLTDLTPGLTYRVRLTATNASGSTLGAEVTFVAQ